MALIGGDSQVEVEGVRRNPGGDFFRPLDGQTPRADEKIFQHEGVDLAVAFEAIGVHVDKRACGTAVQCEDIESRTGHRLVHAKATCEALDKRRLADAQIAVERERGIGRQRDSELAGERVGLFG